MPQWKQYAKKLEFIDVLIYDGSPTSAQELRTFLPDNVEIEKNAKGEVTGNLLITTTVFPPGKTTCYPGGNIIRHANGTIEGTTPEFVNSCYEEVMEAVNTEMLVQALEQKDQVITTLNAAATYDHEQIAAFEKNAEAHIIEIRELKAEIDNNLSIMSELKEKLAELTNSGEALKG